MLDARKLSEETLQTLKHRSHQLRLQGYAWSEVSRTLGLSLSTVLRWAKRYQLGEASLQEKRHVARNLAGLSRAKRILNRQEESLIIEVLSNNTPESLKHPDIQGKLWTRRRVQQMIRLKVGVFLPTRTVNHYLIRWGLSGQRPWAASSQVGSTGFQAWLDQNHPEIAARIRASQSVAYWFQSESVRSDAMAPAMLLGSGATQPSSAKHFLSAIDRRGVLHFRLHDDFSAERYTAYQFAQDLEADTKKSICMMYSALYHVLFDMDPRTQSDNLQMIAIPYLNSAIFESVYARLVG